MPFQSQLIRRLEISEKLLLGDSGEAMLDRLSLCSAGIHVVCSGDNLTIVVIAHNGPSLECITLFVELFYR